MKAAEMPISLATLKLICEIELIVKLICLFLFTKTKKG